MSNNITTNKHSFENSHSSSTYHTNMGMKTKDSANGAENPNQQTNSPDNT